ncbi:MAG: hypothetical protein EPO32_05585 [Anaerolineae bacterium]|nr:MAG: hypothetical protein EPO32_05585 [Anaerolineae bacterium]
MENFETLEVIYDDGTNIVSWVGDEMPERDEKFEYVFARLKGDGWVLDSTESRNVELPDGTSHLVHYATLKRPRKG